jgi:thioredoxin reductase (NADPH)
MNKFDLLIIGSGPGGNTAAIYASRANLKVAVSESGAPGGRLVNTAEIENYPGFELIKGYEFALKLINQAKKFGTEFIYSKVIKIINKNKTKEVYFENGETIETKAIVIATGTRSKPLENVKGYEKFLNRGVSHCIVCDGAFFKNKDITVIGGGNAATEETLFAHKLFNKISIINSFPDFRVVEDVTMKKLDELENVELHVNSNIKEIVGEKSVEKIIVEQEGKEKEFNTSAVFVYIGNLPNTEFIKESNLDILND